MQKINPIKKEQVRFTFALPLGAVAVIVALGFITWFSSAPQNGIGRAESPSSQSCP